MDLNLSRALSVDIVSWFFPLSLSESDVLVLIGEGLTNREIAERRGRSLETVNSQVKSLFIKTYARSRAELVLLSLSLDAPLSV